MCNFLLVEPLSLSWSCFKRPASKFPGRPFCQQKSYLMFSEQGTFPNPKHLEPEVFQIYEVSVVVRLFWFENILPRPCCLRIQILKVWEEKCSRTQNFYSVTHQKVQTAESLSRFWGQECSTCSVYLDNGNLLTALKNMTSLLRLKSTEKAMPVFLSVLAGPDSRKQAS